MPLNGMNTLAVIRLASLILNRSESIDKRTRVSTGFSRVRHYIGKFPSRRAS